MYEGKRVESNGNVRIVIVPVTGVVNPAAPTAAELNLGYDFTEALAWEGTTFPAPTESNDTDDRNLLQRGNALTRGYAQFEGTLNFFYPEDLNGTFYVDERAYQFFKKDRVPVYVITQVLQSPTGAEDYTWVGGEIVSVLKYNTDTFITDTEGEDKYKYAVELLPQGVVHPQTFVVPGSKGAITVERPSSGGLSEGPVALRATLYGHRVTNQVNWSSSNPSVVTVSNNGVVTAQSSGTAEITARHPAGTSSIAVPFTVS